MTDRLAMSRRHRDELEALLTKHVPDVEVWAYGSRVNGESHEASDLDLVLRGPALEPLGNNFCNLLEAIEKSNIPFLIQAHERTWDTHRRVSVPRPPLCVFRQRAILNPAPRCVYCYTNELARNATAAG